MDDRFALKSEKYSCSDYKKLTKPEKCLLTTVGFFVIFIIYLGSNLLATTGHVCMTEKCIRSAAHILENIDKTIDPCDDFYKFACGSFIKNTIIPGDKATVSTVSNTRDKIILQLMNLFEEPYHDNDPHSLNLIKIIYNSCMNTTKFRKEVLEFVKKEFKNLGGWPVLEHNWNERKFDWENLVYRLKTTGFRRTFLFRVAVDTDSKNSSKHILTISQPSMGYVVLNRDYNDTLVKATYNFLVEVAVLFGADRATAVTDIKDLIDFEIELADLLVSNEEHNNIFQDYNPSTIRELQRNYSSIPWLKLLNSYLFPVDFLDLGDTINVMQPEFFKKLDTFLPKVKKRTLANFIFLRILRDLLAYLPEEFTKQSLKYIKIVFGKNDVMPRWKSCMWEAARLHFAVSHIHIKYLFDKSIKQKVTKLTTDIKESFLNTLRQVKWMDPKTKKRAILKAKNMKSYVGYPDEFLEDKNVEEYYRDLQLNPNEHYIKIHLNLSKFSHKKKIQKLRKLVKKPYWVEQARTYDVGAFYVPAENTIELPAAVLQDYFFDPDRPQYLNYGAIGQIIGHEITHGFDNDGKQYDKDGNVIDWWEPETTRTFNTKTQCLVDQYENYTIPEIEMNLDGVRTLSENIADNGGIKIAYKGYLKWVGRNKIEPSLPGLPYTPRQLFWISAANIWCTKSKKEFLKKFVTFGYHSPKYFRVVVPFMNSDYFGRDFNCPLGSPMNPKNKCKVW
ncbi:hypothetical protein Zmor_013634 [Zophobas morio]|uniref:Membrane metallo-endopeptidase-like 1 n=1 Tax=Zophobas morio TaxID=2755281 RepID=A0AA38IEC4_9CUCU|nr:hypothetical protein Zmor_013634 [Zophobas morio]